MLFVEEPIFSPNAEPRLERSDRPEGLTVVLPVLPEGVSGDEAAHLTRQLLQDFLTSAPPEGRVLWYYTPMALAFSRELEAAAVVYDNMDELSAFLGAPPRLLALERELFAKADLVFTGGMSLYAAKRGRHHSVHAFPSSIDVDHFGQARLPHPVEPDDQASIPGPRIGFFGVIDERMDLELVRQVADLRPEWHFLMIGPVVKIDPGILPKRSNLHWLGPKPYSQLPEYLAGWDAGFMPFALNDSTRFISPTKTPEFLAAGVPVVSTPIADVVSPYGERQLVEIGDSAAELVKKLERLLARPREPWLDQVDSHLATMSWDRTWSAMHDLIEKAVAGRRDVEPARTAMIAADPAQLRGMADV